MESLRLPVMLKFADNMNAIVVSESSISVVIRDQSVSLMRVESGLNTNKCSGANH
jgi:hypothetical protein